MQRLRKCQDVFYIACQHYNASTLCINQWNRYLAKLNVKSAIFSVCIKWICIYPLNLIIFTQEPTWFPDFVCIKWGNASSEVCIKWGITVFVEYNEITRGWNCFLSWRAQYSSIQMYCCVCSLSALERHTMSSRKTTTTQILECRENSNTLRCPDAPMWSN